MSAIRSSGRGRRGVRNLVGAFVLAAAVATSSAGAAEADSVDDNFINSVAAQGIAVPRPQLIAAGHTICSTASAVGSHLPARFTRMLPVSYTATMLGLPADQAASVVDAALNSYCPQYVQP